MLWHPSQNFQIVLDFKSPCFTQLLISVKCFVACLHSKHDVDGGSMSKHLGSPVPPGSSSSEGRWDPAPALGPQLLPLSPETCRGLFCFHTAKARHWSDFRNNDRVVNNLQKMIPHFGTFAWIICVVLYFYKLCQYRFLSVVLNYFHCLLFP